MLTLDELKDKLYEMGFEDSVVLESPDFITAVVGIDAGGRVVYDYDLMVDFLLKWDETMSLTDAMEYIDVNVANTLSSNYRVGEPILVYKLS